jgi:hypothetical protein
MDVRATGAVSGTIKRIEQVLRDRQSGVQFGAMVESGPFPGFGNTPMRSYDPLKTYGFQSFIYHRDLGFDGRSADLVTTVSVEDSNGVTGTLDDTMRWELLASPTPKAPVNVTVRQNDPASGCAFDPVHGFGILLDLSWDPPPATVPVASYSISVFDGRGRDLLKEALFTTETAFRVVRCGVHVEPDAERGARSGSGHTMLSRRA